MLFAFSSFPWIFLEVHIRATAVCYFLAQSVCLFKTRLSFERCLILYRLTMEGKLFLARFESCSFVWNFFFQLWLVQGTLPGHENGSTFFGQMQKVPLQLLVQTCAKEMLSGLPAACSFLFLHDIAYTVQSSLNCNTWKHCQLVMIFTLWNTFQNYGRRYVK